jgi:ABC-type Fe3+-hydroxamate transport system substrate-binding protein
MRLVSLVPSWTETLLWAGVDVVGRTRFCVHPSERCESIPEVGGTKEIDWRKLKTLEPELIVLDKEENSSAIAEESSIPLLVTHIKSVSDVSNALTQLAETLKNSKLEALAKRWQKVSKSRKARSSLEALPGVVQWIRKPSSPCTQLLYLIWKSPLRCVSRDTFIGSVFEQLGYGAYLIRFDQEYPEIALEDFDSSKTLLLFATEPYPFFRELDYLRGTGYPAALVDGEKYSWFGLRSLLFLEECFQNSNAR